jgi:hypothetical protein
MNNGLPKRPHLVPETLYLTWKNGFADVMKLRISGRGDYLCTHNILIKGTKDESEEEVM